MTPLTPTDILIPLAGRTDWIEGWTGPATSAREPSARLGPFASAYDDETIEDGSWLEHVGGAERELRSAESLLLDPRRREVQHLLCDRLQLPDWMRSTRWCAALVWAESNGWSVEAVARRRPNLYIGNDYLAAEGGTVPPEFGVTDAEALARRVALATDAGLLLPTPTGPLLWPTELR